MSDEIKWNHADDKGIIHVPDYLDPLINKVGMQLRLHTISGISEPQVICNIVYLAEKFFKNLENERIHDDAGI